MVPQSQTRDEGGNFGGRTVEIAAASQLANCPADVFERAEKAGKRPAAGQREANVHSDQDRQGRGEKIEPRGRLAGRVN